MTTATATTEKFDEIEALLPWHAAGTLDRRDAERVEKALATDAVLAARFELVREELGETIGVNESLGAPSARARDKLFAMIDAEPLRKPAARLGFVAWMTEFVASLQPRTLAYGATAAALLVLLQAGILGGLVMSGHGGAPELASYSAGETAQTGSFVLVRFQPQATMSDVSVFLSEMKATVVSGPAPGGLYRIQVSEQALGASEMADVVKRVSQNPAVSLTLPYAQPQ